MSITPPVQTVKDTPLTDEEVRALAIALLTAETPRDRQRRVGASDLSNPCDYCLACALKGIDRSTAQADRAWGGRVSGNAIHDHLEDRFISSVEYAATVARQAAGDPVEEYRKAAVLWIGQNFPNALLEQRLVLGELGTYGEVRSRLDAAPNNSHVIDWKGSERFKSLLLTDYLISVNYGPFAGREQYAIKKARGGVDYKINSKTIVHLSDNDWEKEMGKQAYKVRGYYGQLQAYGLGMHRLTGVAPKVLSNVFINRDGNMWFDNPALEDYTHQKRVHDVWVLSFPYDEAQAMNMWNRGLSIWEYLEQGGTPDAFPSAEHCFPCDLDGRYAAQAAKLAPAPEAEAVAA